jgi:hypothetical protein
LPAGSVRALLTLMVLSLVWALMAKGIQIPIYLYYLMFLVLGSFFAAHGHSIAGPATGSASPLYLPRGTLRTLIIVGFLAVLIWRYYEYQDLNALMDLKPPTDTEQTVLPFVLVAAFFLGVIFSRTLGRMFGGPQGPAPWVQDIQAWLALLATLALGAEVIIQLVINPGLPPERQLTLPRWQAVLTAITGFYFGARS